MALDWKSDELARGLGCYRAGEFFEAHEHWEAAWLGASEPEKTFLQALIQIAGAFHHLGRGNAVGAASLLGRALVKLERYPERFGEVDVRAVRAGVDAWLEALADPDIERPENVPPIG